MLYSLHYQCALNTFLRLALCVILITYVTWVMPLNKNNLMIYFCTGMLYSLHYQCVLNTFLRLALCVTYVPWVMLLNKSKLCLFTKQVQYFFILFTALFIQVTRRSISDFGVLTKKQWNERYISRKLDRYSTKHSVPVPVYLCPLYLHLAVRYKNRNVKVFTVVLTAHRW